METNIICPIEELSLNAWPALQTLAYDGWLLRFAAGYTKRANSINPLYRSTLNLSDKIAHCEALYAHQYGLDVVFKLTEAAQPAELDAVLEARGYHRLDETSVQTLELNTLARKPNDLDDLPASLSVNLSPTLTQDWLGIYTQLSNVAERHVPTMERMLGNIVAGQTCFLTLMQHTEAVAVGLAVLERGYVGLFDITVAAPLRGQGLGTHLMEHLLRWGIDNGAHTAYLQVVKTNAPALQLYSRLGFVEQYSYWYRVRRCEP